MTPGPSSPHNDTPPEDGPSDDITGLPGLRTWRSVYLLVVMVFIIYVVLLTVLSRAYA